MAEWRQFVIMGGLALLAGIIGHRVAGPSVDPITALVIAFFAVMNWVEYRNRKATVRRAVIELGAYAAAERTRLVNGIDSDELREAVSAALMQEGTENLDGPSEIFPFPNRFRRRAVRRFWRDATFAAVAFLVAALVPALSPIWRVVLVVVGVILALRARRMNRWYRAVDAVIEINPYRIAYVAATGHRETISFADGAVCEDIPDKHHFIVRSGKTTIPVSYYMIGFDRLAALLEQYGAVVPGPTPPAS